MLYRNLIKIKRKDLVLEIGPGSKPYWRSDFIVDKYDIIEEVIPGNFGVGKQIETNGKPFLKIENNHLPFNNNSFDFVICSHVLEHVPVNDIELLISEIFRVGSKAYIEFPSPLYDIIFDFDVHLNLMDIDDDTILCLPKNRISCQNRSFKIFNQFLRQRFSYNGGKEFRNLMVIGKVFNNDQCKIKIFDNESDFFERVINKKYYCNPPSLLWKMIERIKSKFYLRKSYKVFEKLLS